MSETGAKRKSAKRYASKSLKTRRIRTVNLRPTVWKKEMNEKGTQVAIGLERFKKTSTGTQTPSVAEKYDKESQCVLSQGSYGRGRVHQKWRYYDLMVKLQDKENFIKWLMTERLLAKDLICFVCKDQMKLVRCNDQSDVFKWECRRQINNKRHKVENSISSGSWFYKSNMMLEEILQFTYLWCQDLDQAQIRHELGLNPNTGVDWDSFCRVVCEIQLFKNSVKIGEESKVAQIDEGKFGKQKYHRGHHVEGQWVFGGIESNSRNCFLIAVEKRDEATLLPIIKKWNEPGTFITSDCWKAYCNLEKYGYRHFMVNHSKEFVNAAGQSTKKMEGHWRQAKAKLPPFGVTKHQFSSYLAELMWKYMNREEDLFQKFLEAAKVFYPF